MSEGPVEAVQDADDEDAPPVPPAQTDWLMLTDPAWAPRSEDEQPPIEAVLGGWPTYPDGSWGHFLTNPGYEPSTPDSPSDPVDAVLRLIARDDYGADALLSVLADVELGIATDEQSVALVDEAPDGKPSVLVVTSLEHRDRVAAPGWYGTDLSEIVAALPESGVDVLLNPNSPASMRLDADVLRNFLAESEPESQGEIRTETG